MRASRLPEPFVFFVDECLKCSAVDAALRSACAPGETVKTAAKGTLDEDWLREAGLHGWVCFSKDRQMLKRPNEIAAILQSGVGLFTLGEASGAEHARIIAAALPIVRRAARVLNRAFVARLDPGGDLVVSYRGGEKLSPPTRMKPKLGERPR